MDFARHTPQALAITVFCASSDRVDPMYQQAATDVGAAIASAGHTLVYGGNAQGMMGLLANSARRHNGKVIGITPKLFVDKNLHDKMCHILHVVDDMRARRAMLTELADAVLVLPGGIGTYEEMFEVIVGRLLRYHDKPIVVLNIGGAYDWLNDLLDRGIRERFIRPATRELVRITPNLDEALVLLRGWHVTHHPLSHYSAELDYSAKAPVDAK